MTTTAPNDGYKRGDVVSITWPGGTREVRIVGEILDDEAANDDGRSWYGRKPDRAQPFTDLFIKSLLAPRQAGRGYTATWLSFNDGVERDLKRKWTRYLPHAGAIILLTGGIAVWLHFGWL